MKVKLPKVRLQPVTVTKAAVVVQGPVKAFVIGPYTLKQLFQPEAAADLSIYVVESNRIAVLEHHDGRWQPADFE